jgi:hypothetical protein
VASALAEYMYLDNCFVASALAEYMYVDVDQNYFGVCLKYIDLDQLWIFIIGQYISALVQKFQMLKVRTYEEVIYV